MRMRMFLYGGIRGDDAGCLGRGQGTKIIRLILRVGVVAAAQEPEQVIADDYANEEDP